MAAQSATASTFLLSDHPNGNEQANYDYGLRIDGLNIDGQGPSFFTFQQGGAKLTRKGTTAHISGAVHKSNFGNVTDLANPWTLNYTLNAISTGSLSGASLNNGFSANNQSGANGVGYLSDGKNYFALRGRARADGAYTFQFDDDGHRIGGNDWVGRGWIEFASCDSDGKNCGAYSHTGAQDFLFSAKVAAVPLPAAGLMLLSGFGALGALRRRRAKAA